MVSGYALDRCESRYFTSFGHIWSDLGIHSECLKKLRYPPCQQTETKSFVVPRGRNKVTTFLGSVVKFFTKLWLVVPVIVVLGIVSCEKNLPDGQDPAEN